MRRVTTLIISATVVASPAGASARLPSVLTQHARAPFQVRPATIDFTGDSSGLVGGYDGTSVRHRGHVRWTTYRARSAVGKGLLWVYVCSSSCGAHGGFEVIGVTVHLGTPRGGRYQHLTLSYVLRGRRQHDRRIVVCPPAYPASACYWQPLQ